MKIRVAVSFPGNPQSTIRNGKFLAFVCALLFALCFMLLARLPARAQQPKKIARVGYLAAVTASADAPRLEAFRQGLRELGYVEGQNLVIEFRHEAGGFERLPELAAELVRFKPDVLVAVTTNAALATRKATTAI